MATIYLLVTIDTEEDAWGFADCSCLAEGKACPVENVYLLPRIQEIFDEFDIRPVYLCNAPVLADQQAVALLKGFSQQNKCEIGCHIHPWNTLPISEEINATNSYLKNLSPSLIKKKLTNITSTIISEFDTHPQIFRAGRWGMNAEVIKVLVELGYKIDTSVTPYTTWKGRGNGADFTHFPDHPYYMSLSQGIAEPAPPPGDILEVPVSIGFNRTNSRFCYTIRSLLKRPLVNQLRLLGIFHKTGIMKKIWLSPELNSAREMVTLSNILLTRGINLLNFTLHSTSLMPGKSPFIKSPDDVDHFLDTVRRYFAWLHSRGNVQSVTSKEILDLLDRGRITLCPPEE